MANQAKVALVPVQMSIDDKIVEAHNTLCTATFVAEFLCSAVSNSATCAGGLELDEAETLGFIAVMRDLTARIEKAAVLLDEYREGAHLG
jgi:hypothetical protein